MFLRYAHGRAVRTDVFSRIPDEPKPPNTMIDSNWGRLFGDFRPSRGVLLHMRSSFIFLTAVCFLIGCGVESESPVQTLPPSRSLVVPPPPACPEALLGDTDCDGHYPPADCNNSDAAIHPGAPELCGNIDEDCDGIMLDVDCDGFVGVLDGGNDCVDTDANISPGAMEIGGNLVDENCDGVAEDLDGDGFSEAAGDCNDSWAHISPGATEVRGNNIDENCDGVAEDKDGDGYSVAEGDCKDEGESCAMYYPGAPNYDEAHDWDCDGLLPDTDNDGVPNYLDNCVGVWNPDQLNTSGGAEGDACDVGLDPDGDGILDPFDNCPATFNPTPFDGDMDSDGVGDACDENTDRDGDRVAAEGGDCNDHDATIYPGATEIVDDGIDQDCNGADLLSGPDTDGDGLTDALDPDPFNPDADGDGLGDAIDPEPLIPHATPTPTGDPISD